jgi:hypothetical protein
MTSTAYFEALSRDLADQGKLIEAGWIGLRACAIHKDATELEIEEMRMAFMAGAQHLFSSIIMILDPGAEPTGNDLKRMDLIDQELRAFRGELEARIIPTEGNA